MPLNRHVHNPRVCHSVESHDEIETITANGELDPFPSFLKACSLGKSSFRIVKCIAFDNIRLNVNTPVCSIPGSRREESINFEAMLALRSSCRTLW
jgi:hypothetical protein